MALTGPGRICGPIADGGQGLGVGHHHDDPTTGIVVHRMPSVAAVARVGDLERWSGGPRHGWSASAIGVCSRLAAAGMRDDIG
jgi:hypothetical protein